MKDIIPINYKIHLEPDLKSFRFEGSTEILIEASTPIAEISLNMLELAVWSCKLRVDNEFLDCPFYIDPKKEVLNVSLPNELQGKIELKVDYVGEINNKMAGFYRSKYAVDEEEKISAIGKFNEKHRLLYKMLEDEIGSLVAKFVTKMVGSLDEDVALLFSDVCFDAGGKWDEKALKRNIRDRKIEGYGIIFDTLIDREKAGLLKMLDSDRSKRMLKDLEVIEKVGLTPSVVDSSALALFNLVSMHDSEKSSGTKIILDIGKSRSNFIIYSDKDLWIRSINIAGEHFTRAIQKHYDILCMHQQPGQRLFYGTCHNHDR